MDDHDSSGAFDFSLEDLNDEYSSRPPQIAVWLWCIEYIAKFYKDLHCIRDMMNMGYHYSNDYGRRINEVLSLRILEFMFDPSKNEANGVGVASTSEAKIEFDLSLSSSDVLRAILKEIPVSEIRADMPELSKFNVLPFIAHKNMCLPQCAFEKLIDMSLMENQTTTARSMETNDPVFRDDRSVHMDTCEDEPLDEQQVQNINENVSLMENQITTAHSTESNDPVFRDNRSVHIETCGDEPIYEQQVQNTNENVSLMENQITAAPSTETNDLVSRDDRSANMDTCEDEPIGEQQLQNINENMSLMENQITAAHSTETNDPVFRDDRSVHVDTCEEDPVDDQEMQNINENDEVIANADQDEPMHTNEKDELLVIGGDNESDQDISKDNSTDESFSPSSKRSSPEDARVKCTKDGTLLISGSDDDSDMVEDSLLLPLSYENVCWKCQKEGTLLICSRSECAAKVHEECLNCPVNIDEDGKFLCPLCWYDKVSMEYEENQKLISSVKRRLAKCFQP